MAKMTAVQKKAFLKRMSAGRAKAGKASTGRAKSAGAGRVTGRKVTRKGARKGAGSVKPQTSYGYSADVVSTEYPGVSAGSKWAIIRNDGKVISSHRTMKAARAGSAKAARGGYRSNLVKIATKSAGSTAIVRAPAVPARTGRQSGAMATGTPVARLQRVESAVMDLARANHAVVNKVVEHERRLNSVESTLSNWAKGRR